MSNEIATSGNKAIDAISSLRTSSGIMSTVTGDDFESKKVTIAALTNAEPISEHLGETIDLVHVVLQAVEIADEKTGEMTDAVRVVLLDSNGNSFAAVSNALVGSLRDIFGILGQPGEWGQPLPIKIVEQRGRNGYRFYKVALV